MMSWAKKVGLQVKNTPELKAVQILNSADLNSVNLSLLDVFWKCKRWLDVPLVSRVEITSDIARVRLSDSGQNGLL